MTWRRPVTVAEMREHAATLRQRAAGLEDRSLRRFDSAPGALVTGSAGRRRSGLAKRTARAIDGSLADLAEAKRLRERASDWSARADRSDPEWLAAESLRRQKREADRAAVREAESAARKAAPILNRSAAGLRMTSAEWGRIHRDFRAIAVREVDGVPCRVRTAMHEGGLAEVYLVDRRVVEAGR